MNIHVIVGKNFGDEGKGLATDYFAAQAQANGRRCLVIRHNGGGQAGHTVDLPDKRFVFHQLSSGSFRGADTWWSQTFLPDLYKLPEELEQFEQLHDQLPRIFAHPKCRCVYIDDVLVNMALETSRGGNRHGSCGMGINEAVERSADPAACLYLGQIHKESAQSLYEKLLQMRRTYLPGRLKQLGLSLDRLGEYGELLSNPTVLKNAAEQMCYGLRFVTLQDEGVIDAYEELIFEGAQGLLLDEDYLAFAPHLTSSKTGMDNPGAFIKAHVPEVTPELVYVTRSYVTRHGEGPLPHWEKWAAQNVRVTDPTNTPNPWQGALRFAPHGAPEEFFAPMAADVQKYTHPCKVSCMVTHLNETRGKICSVAGDLTAQQWFSQGEKPQWLEGLYLSSTPYARDIQFLDLKIP